eukprot:14357-Heterococcus_DN1.PRE.6
MRRCAVTNSKRISRSSSSNAPSSIDNTLQGGWSAEDAAAAVSSASHLEYNGNESSTALHQVVSDCANATNKRALHLVMVEHDLTSHLRAHKKFLLLSQGDFVTTLLDTVSAELSKPAKSVYQHNLSGIVDSALRGGAAQAPLSSVITARASQRYKQMFSLLWRIKVLESSWLSLTLKLEAATDLDMVIAAHDDYLQTILDKALLGSDEASQMIMKQLNTVLKTIILYCSHQEALLVKALSEVAANKEQAASAIKRTDA